MSTEIGWESSEWHLSSKQAKARKARKNAFAAIRSSADSATKQLRSFVADGSEAVVLRRSFSYLRTPINDNTVSDRSTPPRELRPPATRLVTSRGMALRFMLTALAVKQQGRALGGLPIESKIAHESGWTDLVASPSTASRAKAGYLEKAQTKRRKQITTALGNIEDAGLVELGQGMKKFEDFKLLDEGGISERAGQELIPYRKPGQNEEVFKLPAGFFENGWVHILQDSEIALLLMVKCGVASLSDPEEGVRAIDSFVRLHHYGIGRDSFSAALLPLEELGLLRVDRRNRNPDGTHVGHKAGEKAPLHRLKVLGEGFDEDALNVGGEVYGV